METPPWLGASAGDGGGGEHSMGEDVKGTEAFSRSVSTTGVTLGREVVFKLLSGTASWGVVAEPSGCLA